MARYLILWEGDMSRQPVDFKERGQGYKQALAMVKQDLDSGVLKEWGKINGLLKGFWIAEGSEVEISMMMEKYKPYFSFTEISPIVTYEQAIEFINVMLQSD